MIRALPGRLRVMVALAAVLIVVLVVVLVRCSAGPDVIKVAAVGDMACDPDDPAFHTGAGDRCKHREVSDLAVAIGPDVFLGLGDFQYELPAAEAYRTVYGPTFGRLWDRTVPVFGNQEYKVQNAGTFTAYFGERIRDEKGYWSQDIGRWHLVVLNSNCAAVAGGCGAGSPQHAWLEADLAATNRRCVIAAWHHPRWSSGIGGSDVRTDALFRVLYDHGVELVLSGHDAHYERFEPVDPDGRRDEQGVRQFVVGTGGQAHYRPPAATGERDERGDPAVRTGPASAFADYDHHGVLELELAEDSWTWWYRPVGADRPVTDTGTANCL